MSTLQLVAIGVALGTLAIIPAAIYWWRRPPRSTAGRVVYWACFAPVLGLGAFAMGALALEELRDGRVGLGTGFCLAAVLGLVKGLGLAAGQVADDHRDSAPS